MRPSYTTPFVVGWDKNGGTGQGLTAEINAASRRDVRQT